MADEKPKTLQEQSSPTGPPVSQEGKDTALAVVQPGEEKDKTADTKSVEAKGTEAAGSKKLDDIVHPEVKKYILREIERSRKEETEFFFIEAALLLEEKYDEICDEIWYIYCEKEVRMERLRRDRGYSDEKIKKLMDNQLPEEVFEERCDFQLYNDEDVAHTYLQIERKMRTYYESL